MRSKGKLNAKWHAVHPMSEKLSRKERVIWHYEHSVACGCRPVPEDLSEDVRLMTRHERGRLA